MERIGTELARRDSDGTGEWNGLALNWQGDIVMALDNGTDWHCLARRDRDGTGEWNGLALNWQGGIVMAPENGTDWH